MTTRPRLGQKPRGRDSRSSQRASKADRGSTNANRRVWLITESASRARKVATGPRKRPNPPWSANSSRSEPAREPSLRARCLRPGARVASPTINWATKKTLQKLIGFTPFRVWAAPWSCSHLSAVASNPRSRTYSTRGTQANPPMGRVKTNPIRSAIGSSIARGHSASDPGPRAAHSHSIGHVCFL